MYEDDEYLPIICPICTLKLIEKGAMAHQLIYDICKAEFFYDTFYMYYESDHHQDTCKIIMKYLEHTYITTTERSPQSIAARPKLGSFDEDHNCFCWCKE